MTYDQTLSNTRRPRPRGSAHFTEAYFIKSATCILLILSKLNGFWPTYEHARAPEDSHIHFPFGRNVHSLSVFCWFDVIQETSEDVSRTWTVLVLSQEPEGVAAPLSALSKLSCVSVARLWWRFGFWQIHCFWFPFEPDEGLSLFLQLLSQLVTSLKTFSLYDSCRINSCGSCSSSDRPVQEAGAGSRLSQRRLNCTEHLFAINHLQLRASVECLDRDMCFLEGRMLPGVRNSSGNHKHSAELEQAAGWEHIQSDRGGTPPRTFTPLYCAEGQLQLLGH